MQLVGATENFIRLPFIKKSILQGAVSAAIAIILLAGTVFYARQRMPEIAVLQNMQQFGLFFIAMLLLGVILSAFSTWISLNKFLRMKIDSLYSN